MKFVRTLKYIYFIIFLVDIQVQTVDVFKAIIGCIFLVKIVIVNLLIYYLNDKKYHGL